MQTTDNELKQAIINNLFVKFGISYVDGQAYLKIPKIVNGKAEFDVFKINLETDLGKVRSYLKFVRDQIREHAKTKKNGLQQKVLSASIRKWGL